MLNIFQRNTNPVSKVSEIVQSDTRGILNLQVEHITWEYVKELNEYKFLSEKLGTHDCSDVDRESFHKDKDDSDGTNFFKNFEHRMPKMQCLDNLEKVNFAGKVGDTFGQAIVVKFEKCSTNCKSRS